MQTRSPEPQQKVTSNVGLHLSLKWTVSNPLWCSGGGYVHKDKNVGLTEPASPSCVNISISASCSRIRLLSLTCSDHKHTAALSTRPVVFNRLYRQYSRPALWWWSSSGCRRWPWLPGSGCCCCCTSPRWAVWVLGTVAGCVGGRRWKRPKRVSSCLVNQQFSLKQHWI